MTIETQNFEFTLSYPEGENEAYTRVGLNERFGFGFLERNSGYVSPIFGPEIFDIKKEYTFTEEDVIGLYRIHGTYYLPDENHSGTNGAVDILIDDEVYRYNETGEKFNGESVVSLNHITNMKSNDPIIVDTNQLEEWFDTGTAVALWPLIEKAHR